MKKQLSLALLASLFLVGCGSVDSSDPATSYKDSWEALKIAAQEKNCDNFRLHTTQRLQITENDCAKAFMAFEEGIPEVDWDKTQLNEDETEAELRDTFEEEIATFIKVEDGSWKTDDKFWR